MLTIIVAVITIFHLFEFMIVLGGCLIGLEGGLIGVIVGSLVGYVTCCIYTWGVYLFMETMEAVQKSTVMPRPLVHAVLWVPALFVLFVWPVVAMFGELFLIARILESFGIPVRLVGDAGT